MDDLDPVFTAGSVVPVHVFVVMVEETTSAKVLTCLRLPGLPDDVDSDFGLLSLIFSVKSIKRNKATLFCIYV